jgi:tetratricopeptide (TPR) repeat protein
MSREKGFPEIGKRLHSVRAELDQRGFSRRVNVSQQAISNYERGNLPASWAFLRRLNEDFNLNLNWLFTGQGLRDYRAGTPYASLTDNRAPGWAASFLSQRAFEDSHPLEILLTLYFLYLATEPADAKARLMADLQAIVDAARQGLGSVEDSREAKLLLDALDALATDNRRAAVSALIAMGEQLEAVEKGRAMQGARRAYLAALDLARLQGCVEDELEAGRRIGRTYRKEGRWADAERFFQLALERVESRDAEADPGPDGTDPTLVAVLARTCLGYGHVAKHKGAIGEARERYLSALRFALKTQDSALRAEVYLDLTCLSYHEKEWQKALDFIGNGRTFAEQAGDRRLLRNLRIMEALVHRERGELETSETLLRVLLQQAEKDRDLPVVALASGNLAEVLVDRGNLEEAERLLERTAGTAEDHHDPRDLALRKLLHARIGAAKGEEGAARAAFVEAMRYAKDHGLTLEFERAVAAFGSAYEARRAASGSKAG